MITTVLAARRRARQWTDGFVIAAAVTAPFVAAAILFGGLLRRASV